MIETDRLILRRPKISDADLFYELENDPEVYRYLPPGRPFDRQTVTMRLQKNIDEEALHEPLGVWVADSKVDRTSVGWALLMKTAPDDNRLGYVVRKQFWGCGFATEIARAVSEIGLQNGLKTIRAVTSPENLASSKVLEKIGFSFKETIAGETPEVKLNLYQLDKIGQI